MKIKFLIITVLFGICSSLISAQQNKFDIIYHKYLGKIEGKIILIKEQSVEIRLAKSNLLYDYPKDEIKYIILANGDWISFNGDVDENNFKHYGSFSINGGIISNVGAGELQSQKKNGYEIQSELSYNASNVYSIGLMLGYSSTKTDATKLLKNNNYSPSNSSANVGNLYQLRVGFNNHFKLLPSLSLVPEINLYIGFSNQIISESTIVVSSIISKIPGNVEKGIEVGFGIGFLIKTGNKSGFNINCQYSRIFQNNSEINFIHFDLGYNFPIN